MNASKNILTLLILAGISTPVLAEGVTVYGKANLSVQNSDDGDGSYTEIKSNTSRIGFKGRYELSDDLEVIYQAEFQVDIDGDSEKGKSITDRNQYVGLRGTFGEVLLGVNDTVLKQTQGKIDVFSDYNADIKALWKGENRVSDSLTYKSPKFNDLQLGVTYIAADSVDSDSAVSLAIFYGDKKLKKSKIYAAFAHDSDVKGYDVTRAVISGKVSGVTVGAIAQTQENLTTGEKLDGLMVSAKYKINKTTLKGQYQTAEYTGGDSRYGITLGADYSLAKSTKLFAFYTSFDMDTKADKDYLAVGIEYKF